MLESHLLWIIKALDQQISDTDIQSDWLEFSVVPLLELRNNILKQFNPSTSLNWEIKNEKVLNIINKLNYIPVYESSNGNPKRHNKSAFFASKTN